MPFSCLPLFTLKQGLIVILNNLPPRSLPPLDKLIFELQVVLMASILVLLLDPTFTVLCQKNGTMVIVIQVDPCGIASVKSLLEFKLYRENKSEE